MDFRALRYFVEVAKEKSINKAAENLYISQPNLSKMIKRLEDEMGVSLFNRNNKGVTLSKHGESLYYYACDIVSQVETIKAISKYTDEQLVSKLSISVAELFLKDDLLSKYYSLCHNQNTIIHLNETTIEGAIKSINSMEAEIGFIVVSDSQYSLLTKMVDYKSLEIEMVGASSLMAHMSIKNEMAKQELVNGFELLQLTRLHLPTSYFDHINTIQPFGGVELHDFKNVVSLNNYHSFINLLKQPNTFLFGHKWNAVELSNGSVKTIKIKQEDITLHLLIIKRKKEILSDEANLFIKLFKETYSTI